MSLARDFSFDFQNLSTNFAAGTLAPGDVVDAVLERIGERADTRVWIQVCSRSNLQEQVVSLERLCAGRTKLPLYGLPFAVKDNIDVAGIPTTVGCPEFAYVPPKSAPVVDRLIAAGAIFIGKTNLDQFATGLVGTRSPYGACPNAFDPRYISGGSSSGSAVAVAIGMVSFALGTDTAGSGRVPAAFNNIVGLKPTRGLLSTAGVFPACRSLDCVSIFALTCGDAQQVFDVARSFQGDDPYSRELDDAGEIGRPFQFGVPEAQALKFFGNAESEAIYWRAVDGLQRLGGEKVVIDFAPFSEAARLLYEGPWVAERLSAIHDFLIRRPDALLPVTRSIIAQGARFDAIQTFEAFHTLKELQRAAEKEWKKMDVLCLPTAGTIYTQEQVAAKPVELNSNLGYYTNFVNLLDLSALAVPAGIQSNGLPAGITLMMPAGGDAALLSLGEKFHAAGGLTLGATSVPLPAAQRPTHHATSRVKLAVVGAHLSGQPLNFQLTERKARLIRTCRTARKYLLYALAGTTPAKPGLVRCSNGEGAAIEVEVWELSAKAFGTFVAATPAPMGIGTMELEDGELVKGFIVEPCAIVGARDITSFGGWRKYLQG